MKVVENVHDRGVTVTYVDTHRNHQINLAHLPIPQPVVSSIVAQLQQGVPVLHKIRDGDIESLGREHFINPQQIHNIRRYLNLCTIEKHKLDPASVLHWVRELQQQDYNPVLYYKAQGEGVNNLNNDDFLLGKYTQFIAG